jgi:hypothetical protein
MTRTDVTSLSGDPQATQTEEEWAEDMNRRLDSLPLTTRRQLWKEMTDDEKDMMRTYWLSQIKRWRA